MPNHIKESDKHISILNEGYDLFIKGNISEANKLFEEALTLSENEKYPYANYGTCRKFMKKLRQNKSEDWTGSFEHKVNCVLKIYNAILQDFAGLNILHDFDWKNKVIEYIPKLMIAEELFEFTEILCEMISLLNDNHTRIYLSNELEKLHGRNLLPVEVKVIDDKFIIYKVDDRLTNENIYPGLEIISIDGTDPKGLYIKYSKTSFLTNVEKERMYRAENCFLGKKDSYVELLVRDNRKEESFTVKLKRNKSIWHEESPEVFKSEYFKDTEILYFKIDSFFQPDIIIKPFREKLRKHDLSKLKALIIDVRENPGGNSFTGYKIISHLIRKEALLRYRVKLNRKLKAGGGGPLFAPFAFFYKYVSDHYDKTWKIKPDKKLSYKGKVSVLISRKTGSAAEDFAAVIKENKIAQIYGESSSGSTGDGVFYSLPGYNLLRVSINCGIYSNGEVWHGKGIQPDVLVSDTVESLMQGRDAVLEKAIEDIIK